MEDHSANNLYYEDFVSISTFLNKKYDMEMNEHWNNTTWCRQIDYFL
jgi:acyl-ACP thioesterase